MVAKRTAVKSGAKCKCNFGMGLVALILFAIGFWIVVNGYVTQWNNLASYWQVMLWYLVGFVVLVFGKMAKWKSHAGCTVHPSG